MKNYEKQKYECPRIGKMVTVTVDHILCRTHLNTAQNHPADSEWSDCSGKYDCGIMKSPNGIEYPDLKLCPAAQLLALNSGESAVFGSLSTSA